MSFKISDITTGTYKWPVHVYIPVDGGKHRKQTFTGVFKRHKTGEDLNPDNVTEDDGVEVFKRFFVGWSDIKDDDGNEVSFTDENLAEFLKAPIFVVSVLSAWKNSIKAAKEGN
jgi:hypothetical protein